MKILCVADQKDPLVYTNTIKERFKDVDLILGAGDLPMDYYGFIVSSLNKPLLFVFGNHHLKELDFFKRGFKEDYSVFSTTRIVKHTYGSVYIGGKVQYIRGLLIAGLGGSMRYNDGENQYTEIGMFCYMLRLLPKLLWNKLFRGRYLDILLTHAPPYGIHDDPEDRCHRGFKVFSWFLRKFKPRYHIHGHIHLYNRNAQRITQYHETTVVNVFSYFVIEIEVKNERIVSQSPGK
jgi:Icc-related predicted phosphoesterase